MWHALKGLNSYCICQVNLEYLSLCLIFQASSPACTELEMNVMDWLAKMLGLPDKFLHHHPDSVGGGVLQVRQIRGDLINISVITGVNLPIGDHFPWGKIHKICHVSLYGDKSSLDVSFPDFRIKFRWLWNRNYYCFQSLLHFGLGAGTSVNLLKDK